MSKDELRLKAAMDNNLMLKEFWEQVVNSKMWAQQGKTESEAINLAGYYEGRYDMAIESTAWKTRAGEQDSDNR